MVKDMGFGEIAGSGLMNGESRDWSTFVHIHSQETTKGQATLYIMWMELM